MTYKATTIVTNGRGETSNITNINELEPGTYTVNGEYKENNTYEGNNDTGTLIINQKATTIKLEFNKKTITLGEALQVTVTVQSEDTTLDRGTITFYAGTDTNIIQTNILETGQSNLFTINPTTTGSMSIYAKYTPATTTYKESTSNKTVITVNPKPSSISTNTEQVQVYGGDEVTITGSLLSENTPLSSQNIQLEVGGEIIQTTTTNNNGFFRFDYTPTNTANITIIYRGNNEYASAEKSLPVTILQHDTILTVPNITGVVNSIVIIPVTVKDENNLPVSKGTVSAELELVSRKGISIVTASGYDWDLEFVSATVFDDGGTDMLNCTLHVVDRNTDEIITDFNGSFADNVLSGVTDVGYQILFPALDYSSTYCQSGVIIIEGSVSDMESIIDTVNNVVCIPISYNLAGDTPTSIEVIQDITEEEAE